MTIAPNLRKVQLKQTPTRFRARAAIASIFTVFFLLSPVRAAAEFAICNQSFDVVNVATGQFERGDFVTRGWWTVGPNQCANVIKEVLQSRYIYVFAQDVFGNIILNGSTPMCVGTGKFVVTGVEDCLLRGLLEASFVEVDTQRTERWTLFLTAPQ
jgi:uncharacterized membrane protein